MEPTPTVACDQPDRAHGPLVFSRTILDPIHGHIGVTKEECAIIDDPLFQRLRGVSQLSGCDKVYPGAKGDRFSHCLGAMHCGHRWAVHLFPDDRRLQRLVRVCALLHDVGHGPFSHAFDRAVYSLLYEGADKGHDAHRVYILMFHRPFIDAIESMGLSHDDVIRVWTWHEGPNGGEFALVREITQGPVGADRTDFLQRDSHNCGTSSYGRINHDRLVMGTSIVVDGDNRKRIVFSEKVVDDLVGFFSSRFYMYHAVYQHKACMGASLLIAEAMSHAVRASLRRFVAVLGDMSLFSRMTDSAMERMIEDVHDDVTRSDGSSEEERAHARVALEMLNEFRDRRLPKLRMEHVVDSALEKAYNSYREKGDAESLQEMLAHDNRTGLPPKDHAPRSDERASCVTESVEQRSTRATSVFMDEPIPDSLCRDSKEAHDHVTEMQRDRPGTLLMGTTVRLSLLDRDAMGLLIARKHGVGEGCIMSLRDHLLSTKILGILVTRNERDHRSYVIKRYYHRRPRAVAPGTATAVEGAKGGVVTE
jgi:hypothetical protein